MAYNGFLPENVINIGKIYSIHYFEYMSDFSFEGESHDFWEFICVDKGEVEVTGGDKKFILHKGELAFHEPNEFHNVTATGTIAPNLIVISFQCDDNAIYYFRKKILKMDDVERNLLASIIFEARPNVTVDGAILCLKSGNAVILRGGKEAINSNKMLADLMRKAVERAGFSPDIIQLVEDTDRGIALDMMKANDYIDVLIPRGGAQLIKAVVQSATVPVIETGTGNCHVYVDASADIKMAVNIVDNGKTSRPSVCNAVESCLVHRDIAEDFLPKLKERLDKHHVEIRGCELTRQILGSENVTPADDDDYATEFLDYIISIKVVDDMAEALEHIDRFSTGHSECIVTESLFAAQEFQKRVDSAAVYVNCSTRFTDGGMFGLGAEIGISTQKLHARGPMGLREMTTTKYLISGNGQIRE